MGEMSGFCTLGPGCQFHSQYVIDFLKTPSWPKGRSSAIPNVFSCPDQSRDSSNLVNGLLSHGVSATADQKWCMFTKRAPEEAIRQILIKLSDWLLIQAQFGKKLTEAAGERGQTR